jgi:hypothetical protein
LGVDSFSPCGPYSNVNFIHYMWEHLELSYFKKYAITMLPRHDRDSNSRPRVLYLNHHRAQSDSWKVRTQCYRCVDSYIESLKDFTSCLAHAAVVCVLDSRHHWWLLPPT